MKAEERLRLIGAKARRLILSPVARPKGVRLANDPDAEPAHRMKWSSAPKKTGRKWRSSVYGLDLGMSQTGANWTKQPDPEPKDHCETKRRRGAHYLEAIAEKMPGKLPKLASL